MKLYLIGDPGRSIAGPPGIDGYPGQSGLPGAKGESLDQKLNMYL
jgi:hypothetical protein